MKQTPGLLKTKFVTAHDRISGSPQMVRVWDEFLSYAKSKAGVSFMRKDEIAKFTASSSLTLREHLTCVARFRRIISRIFAKPEVGQKQ
jgi:hypothetical protein